MLLNILQFVAILLVAVVGGMFWGPWLALSRSMAQFEADVFLAIVHRMDRNMATLMTALFPVTLLAVVALAATLLAEGHWPRFYVALAALVSLVAALAVTLSIEVPIVASLRGKTVATLPAGWQNQRDRWVSFHLLRVAGGLGALALLLVGVTMLGQSR